VSNDWSASLVLGEANSDKGEYKREFTDQEWKKLEPVFGAVRLALAIPGCSQWITNSIKGFQANPLQDLNSLISLKQFFLGGKPGSMATTYINEGGKIDDVWIGLRRSFFRRSFMDQVETILHELRHASALGAILHPEDLNGDLSAINRFRQAGGVVETQEQFDEGVRKNCIGALRKALSRGR
jgi:hypothetical protein